jgi:hypothetical protein
VTPSPRVARKSFSEPAKSCAEQYFLEILIFQSHSATKDFEMEINKERKE